MKTAFCIVCFLICAISDAQDTLKAILSKNDAYCGNGSAQVNIHGGLQPYNVIWSNGTSGATLYNAPPGDYTVSVKDAANRDTVIAFTITDEVCDVSISNHFTPNDDGYNDTWTLINVNYYPDFEVFVYNRWGQIVHHQSQNYIPWDGRHLGVPLPDGPYYYVFYFVKNDKSRILKGDVNILR